MPIVSSLEDFDRQCKDQSQLTDFVRPTTFRSRISREGPREDCLQDKKIGWRLIRGLKHGAKLFGVLRFEAPPRLVFGPVADRAASERPGQVLSKHRAHVEPTTQLMLLNAADNSSQPPINPMAAIPSNSAASCRCLITWSPIRLNDPLQAGSSSGPSAFIESQVGASS